jgi:hypothetical protein
MKKLLLFAFLLNSLILYANKNNQYDSDEYQIIVALRQEFFLDEISSESNSTYIATPKACVSCFNYPRFITVYSKENYNNDVIDNCSEMVAENGKVFYYTVRAYNSLL